jgi:hypothetical protein
MMRWPELPRPVVPTLTLPGFCRAKAITSAMEFGANASDASMVKGTLNISATGASCGTL